MPYIHQNKDNFMKFFVQLMYIDILYRLTHLPIYNVIANNMTPRVGDLQMVYRCCLNTKQLLRPWELSSVVAKSSSIEVNFPGCL